MTPVSAKRRVWHIAAHLAAIVVLGCGSSPSSGRGDSGDGGALDGGIATGGARGGGGAQGAAGAGTSGAAGLSSETFDAGCQRDVSLKAVTLGKPEPFDVVIVADNSDSLSWSRNDLSSGLTDLLANVQGRAVRVFLLTPTQYGASSADAQEPLTGTDVVDWKDVVTGQPYANAMTTYSQTCTDASKNTIPCPSSRGDTPYQVHGTWKLQMPAPIAVLTPDQTASEFAAQQKAVSDAILALGGGGSPHEQPLCTLSRYVSQDRSQLPQHTVFVVLSDEDDQSAPKDCLAAYDASVMASQNQSDMPCSAGCDAYRYAGMVDVGLQRSALDCAAFDDMGTEIAGSDKKTWLNLGNLASCDGFAGGPCTTAQAMQAAPICPTGLTMVTCDQTCTASKFPCSVDLPDSSVDACTRPFAKDGKSYANLADYCAKAEGLTGAFHDCTSGGIKYQSSNSRSGTYNAVPLMSGMTTGDMIQYFTSQAGTDFGLGQYLVEAIVLTPSSSCKLGPGQSYATNLIKLAGKPDNVFPLCESYAGALSGVLGFAQSLVQTTFDVPLAMDENITAVHVIGQNGSDRVLAGSDYSYDHASQVLTVQRGALGAMDETLKVDITSDCRPIVR